jgi:protein-S-isoprenylcysteine O-methyltransferase Ste14
MSELELKIPPVLVAAITAMLMWGTYILTPEILIAKELRFVFVYLIAVVGVAIGLAGVISFKKARTTVNPLKPENCSALVDSGVFKITRNPMYLALLFALIAWGLFLGSIYALVWGGCFVFYMNRFQIQPEERALKKQFGEQFVKYTHGVRRWI